MDVRTVFRRRGLGTVALAAMLLGASGGTAEAGKTPPRKRDTTPPSVTIAAPLAGSTVSGIVSVSGTASDNAQLARVEVSLDGGAYRLAQGTATWSFALDTAAVPSGSHTISARATDGSGNAAVASVSVNVKNTTADTSPPAVAVVAPANGAVVSGTISVSGTAFDNVKLARVDVAVDGGAFQSATGTSSWGFSLNTGAYADGGHTIVARATDSSGNTSAASVSVSFANTAADTTPPTVAISGPSDGATVTGTIAITGTSADAGGVASVQVKIDAGSYRNASGTTAWSYSLDTTALSSGTHTITARAVDAAGNSATASEIVSVQNLPAGVSEQLVTPEGATIQIATGVTGWTAQQVYDLLKPSAYQLSLIGPDLTVKVQTQYPTSTATSAGTGGGAYAYFQAVVYLDADAGTVFNDRPDYVLAHEYGHAWTMYHLYLTQQDDWTPWLTARGLLGNPLLDSSYIWSRNELIADDYRMLFGDAAAQTQASYINPYVSDPRAVAGLRDFFVNVWGA